MQGLEDLPAADRERFYKAFGVPKASVASFDKAHPAPVDTVSDSEPPKKRQRTSKVLVAPFLYLVVSIACLSLHCMTQRHSRPVQRIAPSCSQTCALVSLYIDLPRASGAILNFCGLYVKMRTEVGTQFCTLESRRAQS